ncbi:hypothetical protein BJ508DRAFT_328871 [Ascobolus immersus RN42]|uniref:Uncharacterized protein n=1 Tax=Ascobolus immersus RN42 TaxID=1160509 RepID=A0A3N4I3T7_ASCIM|nr:hypothetical protein BJ508DRAFT_328871 [Ascobolus immersus RN42]
MEFPDFAALSLVNRTLVFFLLGFVFVCLVVVEQALERFTVKLWLNLASPLFCWILSLPQTVDLRKTAKKLVKRGSESVWNSGYTQRLAVIADHFTVYGFVTHIYDVIANTHLAVHFFTLLKWIFHHPYRLLARCFRGMRTTMADLIEPPAAEAAEKRARLRFANFLRPRPIPEGAPDRRPIELSAFAQDALQTMLQNYTAAAATQERVGQLEAAIEEDTRAHAATQARLAQRNTDYNALATRLEEVRETSAEQARTILRMEREMAAMRTQIGHLLQRVAELEG